MKPRTKQNQLSDRTSTTLFSVSFLIHLAWTFYASRTGAFAPIEILTQTVSNVYSYVGFEWSEIGAYLVVAALASSLLINIARKLLEVFLLGWPKFKGHDKDSLVTASMQLAICGAIAYFAMGFFGEQYSRRSPDLINILVIAISTYMAGFIVDLIDEVISGIYCALGGSGT